MSASRYYRCSKCAKAIDYESDEPDEPSYGAECLTANMTCKACVAERRKQFVTDKPPCSIDSTHGVVAVRVQGTFEHFWTCLTCCVQIARAPDRDPDEPEKSTD